MWPGSSVVERKTENLCVASSILALGTIKTLYLGVFIFLAINKSTNFKGVMRESKNSPDAGLSLIRAFKAS